MGNSGACEKVRSDMKAWYFRKEEISEDLRYLVATIDLTWWVGQGVKDGFQVSSLGSSGEDAAF